MSETMSVVQRLLMGDAPWAFLLEIVFRTVAIYIVLFTVMRLMGKRMAAQLSISELAVMITLGAAIGVPLQTPAQGLLPAGILLVSALIFQRGVSYCAYRKRRIEVMTQGDVTMLLEDGRLLLDNLGRASLTTGRVVSELRAMGVQHLGELRRVYLETSGHFSLVRYRTPRAGLWIMPTPDETFSEQTQGTALSACVDCGYVHRGDGKELICPYCTSTRWGPAAHRLGVAAADAV
jgi:hypothetical protein